MVWETGHKLAYDLRCYLSPHSDDIDNNNKFDIIFMVHLVQEGKQGWHLVGKIFGDASQTLKSLHPHLRDAYIRSDNAGCYHVLPILSYH